MVEVVLTLLLITAAGAAAALLLLVQMELALPVETVALELPRQFLARL
jgi:hypothetical protein